MLPPWVVVLVSFLRVLWPSPSQIIYSKLPLGVNLYVHGVLGWTGIPARLYSRHTENTDTQDIITNANNLFYIYCCCQADYTNPVVDCTKIILAYVNVTTLANNQCSKPNKWSANAERLICASSVFGRVFDSALRWDQRLDHGGRCAMLTDRKTEKLKKRECMRGGKKSKRIGSTYFIRFTSVTFAFSFDTSFVISHLQYWLFWSIFQWIFAFPLSATVLLFVFLSFSSCTPVFPPPDLPARVPEPADQSVH